MVIVLPAYNESANLPGLIRRLRSTLDRASAVLIDDGSTDGTADVVREYGWVHLIRHSVNKGLGEALRTGLQVALDLGASDLVVTMDADDTHDPVIIPEMVRAIESGADVVIGSRYRPGGGETWVPPHRRLLSRAASTVLSAICRVPGVRDYTTGFRAYRPWVVRWILENAPGAFEAPGFSVSVHLLLAAAAAGARFAEVPAVVRYDRKQGASKMHVWRTATGVLVAAVAYRTRGVQAWMRSPSL